MIALFLGPALLCPGPARAGERLARQISDIPGMAAGVTDVGQDTTGYLWLSSVEGLSRYDGFEVRPWGTEVTRGVLRYVSTGPGDRVLSGNWTVGLFEVAGGTLRRIEGPEGSADPGAQDAVYDRDGTLWATWDGGLLRRDDEGWVDVAPGVREDRAFKLAPRADGGVVVGTLGGSIWLVDESGGERRIASELGGQVWQILDEPEGAVAVLRFAGRPGLIRVTDDGVEHLLDWSERPEGLLRRGSSYWVAYATGIWGVHDGGRRELLSAREGFAGGGSIGIDREGGVWVASLRGLSHYPQPDTRVWTDTSGLPHSFLRAIHRVGDEYVLTGWRGPMRLARGGRDAEPADLGDLFSRDIGCADPWGGVWIKAFPSPPSLQELDQARPGSVTVVEWRDGRARGSKTGPWFTGDLACDLSAGESIWILAGDELLEVTEPGGAPQPRGLLPEWTRGGIVHRGLVVRRDGSSVIASYQNGTVCEAVRPGHGVSIGRDDWSCEKLTEAKALIDLAETPSGRLWLAAVGGGVFERTTDGWQRVTGELGDLPAVIGLEPSPAGGLWVLGWRERWRVDDSLPHGPPIVVERLGTAHGIPAWQNGNGILEEADGTVWIPLHFGLVRVPAAVREQAAGMPSVTLTQLVADGRDVPFEEPLELRHGDHALEARWSALSFRDPTRVRYRMRLDTDAEWTVLNQPFVRLAGLGAGRHRLELDASLDGRTWSDRPTAVGFSVRREWYLQTWFVMFVGAVILAAMYAAYRLRTAHLLRLERQRTRIATDLHDEMGAGLGSVGLLVGLLGDATLAASERREIGQRAAGQIKRIGESLSDIVWSLRPGTATLDALMLLLRQRVADLFPAQGATRARVRAPEAVPALPLGLPQRRNLQWIAVEALHNAARHATAGTVELRLEPDGADWLLVVCDDGRGIGGESNDGFGLESMQHRASEIGATLTLRSAPGEGTEVLVRFRPARRTR
ncbi:MAG: hypothetical protein GY716_11575 [bacterium]|nr:hypothetical protein [bacterium]